MTNHLLLEKESLETILQTHRELLSLPLLEQILSAVQGYTLLLSSQAQIVFMNERFKNLFPPSQEILGLRLGEALHCLEAEKMGACAVGEACKTCIILKLIENAQKESYLEEDAILESFHQLYHLHLTSRLISIYEQSYTLLSFVEESKKKEIEKEIYLLQKEIERNQEMSLIGTLAAGLAHEINNSLTIILGKTSIIHLTNQKYKNEKIYQSADIIFQQITRIESIIKKLTSHTFEKIPLTFISLTYFLKTLENDLTKKYPSLEFSFEYPQEEILILGRNEYLSQIFSALIENSKEALEKKEEKKVFIRLKDDISRWKIEIEDTGDGIPVSDLDLLFAPFYSTKASPLGLGLGLTVAWNLAKLMLCQLTVSRQKKGALFILWIPKPPS